jgi:Fe-S-cluster-containing dehydrogenase component
MHCSNPPCAKLCPWGAAHQKENGISVIDPNLCLGGSKCKKVCPWHIPQRQSGVGLYLHLMPSLAGNGVMYKCDRCHEKVAVGQLPGCIEACPEEVQTIGPRKEIIRKAHAIAKEIGGFIYGEEENGGTNTIYVSPVPFDLINRQATKEQPHMGPVEDRMADGNNLAKAMFIAPFAGAAAALLKFFRDTKSAE